jgi:hypothetical protein
MRALFREAFTRARPRVPLDDFHAMTDTFLNRLRMDGVQLREDWSRPNYADDWVARGFLARPRADGKFVYELTEFSARFLSYLDGFSSDKTSLNSSRLATLLDRVENLPQESNLDPAAHIAMLTEEVGRREENDPRGGNRRGSPATPGGHRHRIWPVRRLQTHARQAGKDAG